MIDVKDQVLGRIASRIAGLLMGKSKYYFKENPGLDVGDYCVVINANHIKVTGKKEDQKVYYRHSGWPGGLKSTLYKDMSKEKVIELAVKGMIPRNLQRYGRMNRLRIFGEDVHPYEGNILKVDKDYYLTSKKSQIAQLKEYLEINEVN